MKQPTYNSSIRLLVVCFFSTVLTSTSSAQSLINCNCGSDSTGKNVYGYCDSLRSKVIIPCEYDSAYPFNNGLARVIKSGKTGFIDPKGKLVIPAQFDNGTDFNDGFAFVKKAGKCYYINRSGVNAFNRPFVCPAVPEVPNATESITRMLKAQESEAFKRAGFSEGLAIVADSATKKNGFINTKGQLIIPANFIVAMPYKEGLAFVRETPNEPAKAIDKKGALVFQLGTNQMPLPESFNNGYARIMNRPDPGMRNMNIYNYVDQTGKTLLASPVIAAEPFQGNFAVISRASGEFSLINKKGMPVFPETYNYLRPSPVKGIYYYNRESGRGFGLIDTTGKIRTRVAFDNFTKINDTLFLCKDWGSVVYNLLSTNTGPLLSHSVFTKYYWKKTGQKNILVLTGENLFGNPVSLEYDVASGSFLENGKVLATKDNLYLTVNDNTSGSKEEPSVFSYENKHFSLKFTRGMSLYRDSTNGQVYHNSTFYFAIQKVSFKGTAEEYLTKLSYNLSKSGKYTSVEKDGYRAANRFIEGIAATQNSTAGMNPAVFYFIPIDRNLADPGNGDIYVLQANYYQQDEAVTRNTLLEILRSLSLK